MSNLFYRFAKWVLFPFVALTTIGVIFAMATNYTMTQGAGTTFGSLVVGGANFPETLVCDPSAGTCANVSAGGLLATSTNIASIGTTVSLTANQGGAPWSTTIATNNNTDPCSFQPKSGAAFGTTSTSAQVVAGVAGKKVFMCSLSLIAGSAANFSVIEGTGATCTTANEAAIIGATTTPNGMALAANGGLTLGNGGNTIGFTSTTSNGVCLLVSSSVQFAGNMTFVQQ
jgi:hypothetical protein